MYLFVGWSCVRLTLPFAIVIGQLGRQFGYQCQLQRQRKPTWRLQHWYGPADRGSNRGQLDTEEVWVRVTVEFFPCINELSSDIYHFLKKAKISN